VGPLLVAALVLVAMTVVLLLLIVVRRLRLGRDERRHAEASTRLRPAAIAFVIGEEPLPDSLSAYDQTILAEQLRRYSQSLTGEATARIASYFRDSAALRDAVAGLRSRRSWRRADAAFALGDMAVPEVVPALLGVLADRSRIVRTAAARGLGRLQADQATAPLVDALVERNVPRGVAGDALLRVGPKTVPKLRELAALPEPEVQATALTLLGLVGDAGEADAAALGLHDPSAEVRVAAAETLGRIGTPASELELRAALDDRIHFVRAAAAEALGEIGARSTASRLFDVARTDEFRPARAAAQAAAKLDLPAVQAMADEPGAGPHLREAADRAAL